jgi:hypothetical protein
MEPWGNNRETRVDDDTSNTVPGLRVGGYIAADPAHGADTTPDVTVAPEPALSGITLPDIAEYWPDTRTPPATESHRTPAPPAVATAVPAGGRRSWRAAAIGLAVGIIAFGSLTTLTRMTAASQGSTEPAQAPAVVAGSSPASPSQVAEPPIATSGPATSAPDGPTFEMVTDVRELSVRTTRLNPREKYRVETPADSGLRVHPVLVGDVLKVSTTPTGSGDSGKVEVLLSDRIVWSLVLSGGVERSSFDLGPGTVRRIDLNGGALQIDMVLDRQRATVPIRMTGGVSTWRIRTSGKVPIQINAIKGAGEVVVYGRNDGGLKAGSVIRSGNPDDGPGISVDAVAGIGALHFLQF